MLNRTQRALKALAGDARNVRPTAKGTKKARGAKNKHAKNYKDITSAGVSQRGTAPARGIGIKGGSTASINQRADSALRSSGRTKVQGPREATGPKDFLDGTTAEALDRGALSGLSGKAKMGAAAEWGAGNFKASLRPGQSVMGGIAGDMGRGALAGGAIGGTMEASQGGSFWDGAISGATTGAVGWGAYRSGMRATGATSRNPFSKEGIYHAGKRMSNTMGKTPEVSRQAGALLRQSEAAGLSNAVTSRNL